MKIVIAEFTILLHISKCCIPIYVVTVIVVNTYVPVEMLCSVLGKQYARFFVTLEGSHGNLNIQNYTQAWMSFTDKA